jgi:hypothetical protein
MKVRLLNDGRFEVLKDVKFPIEVDAEIDLLNGYAVVKLHQLKDVLHWENMEAMDDNITVIFFLDTECEVLP